MSYLSTAQTKLNGAWQKPLPLSRNLPSTPRYGPLTLSSRSALTKHTGLPVLCPCLTLLLRAHPQRHRTPPPPFIPRSHASTSPTSPLTAPTPVSSPPSLRTRLPHPTNAPFFMAMLPARSGLLSPIAMPQRRPAAPVRRRPSTTRFTGQQAAHHCHPRRHLRSKGAALAANVIIKF